MIKLLFVFLFVLNSIDSKAAFVCSKVLSFLNTKTRENPKYLLPKHTPNHGHTTVAERVLGGMPLTTENLNKLGIPQELHKFYDLRTGVFKYKINRAEHLAAENGSLALDVIRLNLNHFHDTALSVFLEYIEVLRAEPDLKLWINVPESQLKVFAELLDNQFKDIKNRITLIPDPNKKSVAPIWTQDHEKPIVSHGKGYEALIPVHIWKEGEHTGTSPQEALWRATRMQYGYVKSPLQFEGGNIIVGSNQVFVGTDTIMQNMERLKISRPEAIAALSEEFKLPIIEIASPSSMKSSDRAQLNQPIFHIDMMMAVVKNKNTGKDVVLLESPKMALRTLARILPDEVGILTPDARLFDKGFFDKLVGIEKDFIQTLRGVSLKDLISHQQQLDDIARDLTEQGIEVKRIPGLTMHHTNLKEENTKVRHFTWTNSIISDSYVLIPGLGVPRLDIQAQDIYRNLGYRVHSMVSSQSTLPLLGGIRCVSGTYRRPIPDLDPD
ncbi:MAG: hypothetical protein KA116_01520 [Proteobacteria bacterium]|nr:hypothetical protein [Pseudomonadota bacterium]